MDFVALDVETANADASSICQIGIAYFEDGTFEKSWKSFVDPEDFFDPVNISIHGIDSNSVSSAPKFSDLHEFLWETLEGKIVTTHTAFDRIRMRASGAKYGIEMPEIRWLDTACVVRRTWLDLSKKGYGLAPVAARLGIEFDHHDAAEDARAAGEIMLRAMEETGLSLDDWLERVTQPIHPRNYAGEHSRSIKKDGNPEGPLYGEVLVITGNFSVSQDELAELSASMGCEVAGGVTKSTTMLLVGDQDVRQLAGHVKSSKHRKAEANIKKGQLIKIMKESDFRELIDLHNANEQNS